MGLWSRLLKISAGSQIDVTNKARAHFEQANQKLEQGDAKGAIHSYQLALALKPDSASVHFNMGNAHAELKQSDLAIGCYARALEIKPEFVDALFAMGVALEDAGQNSQAIEKYRLALEIEPEHFEILSNIADALHQTGTWEDADGYYQRALRVDPLQGDIWYKRGIALHEKYLRSAPEPALLKEAEACYRQAIGIDPRRTDACVGLANLAHDLGNFEDAIALFQKAISLNPQDSDIHMTLGLLLQTQQKYEDAEISYLRAIEINPNLASALNNLGGVYRKLAKDAVAIEYYKRAIQVEPDFAEAHFNLGATLQKRAQYELAEQCLLKAIALKPDFAEPHYNYGTLMQLYGKLDLAEKKFRRAIELKPDFVLAYSNLGVVLNMRRGFAEAEDLYAKAISFQPDSTDILINWSNTLKDTGRVETAIDKLRQAILLEPDNLQARSNILFNQHYLEKPPAPQMLDDAVLYGKTAARLARPHTTWLTTADASRPIRIGLVSGDLCNHPVGYFLEGILRALERKASGSLEVFAYTSRLNDDETSRKLRAHCKGWHSTLGLSDETLSVLIRDHGIDILIDLSGHTGNSRLATFAWKPAPVQVSWLGYFSTTGLPAMDYFIADPHTLPASEEPFFVEKIWRLPETRLCFTEPDVDIEVNALPALANTFITFACFNNMSKVTDTVLRTWARVINGTPGSRLFIKAQVAGEVAQRRQLVERLAAFGIDEDVLMLEDYGSRKEYFAAYHRVDIALDPFPYPGGTTTAEALWMGIPVLTMEGKSFLARQGSGLLTNAGLTDWIATDVDDYVNKSIEMASDIERLASLRRGLREKVLASPIFDPDQFARNFETALRGMWTHYCASQLT
jgi:predicted O-linked N-acetylglucosamine transferase (SPINDLY family)